MDPRRWAAIADSVPSQSTKDQDGTLPVNFESAILIVAVGPQVGIDDSLTLTYAGVYNGQLRFRATAFYNCNPAEMLLTPVAALRWPRTSRPITIVDAPITIVDASVRGPQCP